MMRKTMKDPGEKIVKDITQAAGKLYSCENKIQIVLNGLRGEDSIVELATDEYGMLSNRKRTDRARVRQPTAKSFLKYLVQGEQRER
ncbi:MAG: hypothetical protein ABJE99_05125 [Roseobacter sp.]